MDAPGITVTASSGPEPLPRTLPLPLPVCSLCHRRKVGCDRQYPCSNCVKVRFTFRPIPNRSTRQVIAVAD